MPLSYETAIKEMGKPSSLFTVMKEMEGMGRIKVHFFRDERDERDSENKGALCFSVSGFIPLIPFIPVKNCLYGRLLRNSACPELVEGR